LGYNFECSVPTYLWTFGDGATSTDRFAQHTYATSNTYHVTLQITNNGGTGTYTANVQVGSSSITPNPTNCGNLSTQTISMTWAGSGCTDQSGDCASTSPVTFTALGNGYSFTCGTHRFDWDYGDGSAHGTTLSAAHTYIQGTFPAKLTVSYGDASITLSKTVHVITPTGTTGNCALMIPDSNVYIVYYYTGNSQCSSVGSGCAVGDPVLFNAFNYAPLYDFACSTHTFHWDFGDGSTSTEKSPTHAYTKNGTFRVKLTITNPQQPAGVDMFKTVVVGTGVSVPPRRRPSGH
jgi:PKD repeat protein